jgi:hypothetical protein
MQDFFNTSTAADENATKAPTATSRTLVASSSPAEDNTFDFNSWLQSDECAVVRHQTKTFSIIRHVSGTLSLVASIAFVCIILRSRIGLSTTLHRLLFGLCVADILSSSVHVLSSMMAPKDLDYVVWNARGNAASCEASGFIQLFGMNMGLFYNASLCLNYLAIVRYNKKDKFIRDKIEPWMHGISVLYSLAVAIVPLAQQNYNFGQTCLANPYNPKHCTGYEDGVVVDGYKIPCGRGGGDDSVLTFYGTAVYPILFGVLMVIVVTMTLMYRSVLAADKKMRKYGRSALNVGVVDNNDIETQEKGTMVGQVLCFLRGGQQRNKKPRPPKRQISMRRRAILNKAFAYSMAWAATYTYFIIVIFVEFVAKMQVPFSVVVPYTLTLPFQGILNFVIFMFPRVKRAKQSKKDNLSWRQACIRALTSRGGKRGRPALTSRRRRNNSSSIRTSSKRFVLSSSMRSSGRNIERGSLRRSSLDKSVTTPVGGTKERFSLKSRTGAISSQKIQRRETAGENEALQGITVEKSEINSAIKRRISNELNATISAELGPTKRCNITHYGVSGDVENGQNEERDNSSRGEERMVCNAKKEREEMCPDDGSVEN